VKTSEQQLSVPTNTAKPVFSLALIRVSVCLSVRHVVCYVSIVVPVVRCQQFVPAGLPGPIFSRRSGRYGQLGRQSVHRKLLDVTSNTCEFFKLANFMVMLIFYLTPFFKYLTSKVMTLTFDFKWSRRSVVIAADLSAFWKNCVRKCSLTGSDVHFFELA